MDGSIVSDTALLRSKLKDTVSRFMMLKGEAEALATRKLVLEREVGFAKGRMALRPNIELFLEELQMEGHAKRVGDIEKLLTALVSEVLPGQPPIGLDLDIDRGSPALDIVSRISADYSEDIFDDQGGAITNIVVLGLRLIAILKSGMRKFVILDESDCWVETSRIPLFYSIVKEVSQKIGVQCFAISHHGGTSFGEGISLTQLTGDPSSVSGVEVNNNPRPYKWSDEEEGLRYIRLQNFQGYVDETLHFTPGINAVSGPNNIGKSSFVRAFRAMFYAEAKNKLIRRGEKQFTIELGFSHGRRLQFNRQQGRNPVNLWRLLGPDGSVVTVDGISYEEGGSQVPDWVSKFAGIGLLEGLDVQLIKQKLPIFLLDKPRSVRASVLAIGQETAHIKKMIVEYKNQCTADNSRIRDGEAEMNTLLKRIGVLSEITKFADTLTEAETLIGGIEGRNEKNVRLQHVAHQMHEAGVHWKKAMATGNALKVLPDASVVKGLALHLDKAAMVSKAIDQIDTANATLAKNKAIKNALDGLPVKIPSMQASGELIKVADEMKLYSTALLKGENRVKALSALPDFPKIIRNDEIIRSGKAIKDGRLKIAAMTSRHAALATLPLEMPSIINSNDKNLAISSLEAARKKMVAADNLKTKVETEFNDCEKEFETLVDEMGHTCPLCNHPIEDMSVFIEGHSHGHEVSSNV